MKLIRMIMHSIRDAKNSLFRNWTLTIASIFSITTTLFIVAFAILNSMNISHIATSIKNDVSIIVFLDRTTNDAEVANIEDKINDISETKTVVFKSRNETKEEMAEEMASLGAIMNEWDETENPLLDSFIIKVNDVDDIKTVVKELEGIEQISLIKYDEDYINNFIPQLKVIEKISFFLIPIFVLVTSLLIGTTIKLAIYSRKNEIEIMRLVGASNTTIKMPFIFEGLITGLLGALAPIGISIYAYGKFYEANDGKIANLFSLLEPSALYPITILILVVMAVLVGMIGSSSAVRKYLKV